MAVETNRSGWVNAAAIIGRLIFAGVFLMALTFKVSMPDMIAGEIAKAGFPAAHILVWVAALFELALVLCFLSGAFFAEACIAAILYVLFLAFSFHGPSHWAGNQYEFGSFIDHFTFTAGLLFAAANGPGPWAVRKGLIGR
jgi:putative oxidoreductase